MENLFRRMKLSEIGQIVAGGTPKTKIEEYWNGDVSWITPKDLSSHASMYISKGERNISQKGLDNSSAKLLPKGTVLFTSRAPIGYVAIARNEVTTNQGFKSIIVDDENDNIFVYYLLKNNISLIENHANGSTFKEISGAVMKNLEFNIPSLMEQKSIAHILSTLDDKIEVNNKINKTLENMAQAIFKQWFVDFEFPNKDGEPYKSSGGEMIESELGMIPKGWEVVEIDSLCSHIKPGTNYQPKRIDNGIPFLNVRNINKGHIDVTDVKYISKEDFENVHKSWVPEENDVLISRIGTLGLVAVIRKRDLPIAVHYNFINFKTKDVAFQFFYFTLKADFFQSQYHGIKKASVQEYVTLDEVKKLKLVIPTNREIFKNFEKKFIDMYELINNKQEETESLIKIRDSLLPKLMSGEIRVPLDEEGDAS